jgi:hypothetical protein
MINASEFSFLVEAWRFYKFTDFSAPRWLTKFKDFKRERDRALTFVVFILRSLLCLVFKVS